MQTYMLAKLLIACLLAAQHVVVSVLRHETRVSYEHVSSDSGNNQSRVLRPVRFVMRPSHNLTPVAR